MLSFETRINGILTSYAHVTNIGIGEDGKYRYYIRYFRPESEPPILEFKISHKRKEGAEKLVLLIHQEVLKLLKK